MSKYTFKKVTALGLAVLMGASLSACTTSTAEKDAQASAQEVERGFGADAEISSKYMATDEPINEDLGAYRNPGTEIPDAGGGYRPPFDPVVDPDLYARFTRDSTEEDCEGVWLPGELGTQWVMGCLTIYENGEVINGA